jgi:hypothetical protein
MVMTNLCRVCQQPVQLGEPAVFQSVSGSQDLMQLRGSQGSPPDVLIPDGLLRDANRMRQRARELAARRRNLDAQAHITCRHTRVVLATASVVWGRVATRRRQGERASSAPPPRPSARRAGAPPDQGPLTR